MGRVSLDGREGEGQQMTLLAVEVAVALFQQYAMSSAEECVPCSPGRVTELITRRARGGGPGRPGAGNISRCGRGAPEPQHSPSPVAGGGGEAVPVHALRAKATRPRPCVVQRGLRVWSCKTLLICPKAANCLLNDHVCLL